MDIFVFRPKTLTLEINFVFTFRAYRFKNKRLLKHFMIVDKGGCPYNFPGVGDVLYVKDLITEEIVSRDFSCSIFGLYSHPQTKIGWVGCIILYKQQTYKSLQLKYMQ